ncbi:transglycosylase domain-containing protein [uncultured Metabacillus sp.]|uniref:transglycosylase domain-containing protein n=1 Tax=uncultured Metabacillus sp. TaxID=2860135 RepID=UPI0026303820|nr:transglycosylase domain-containing protein [uncultured Metabacillus sp.]
MVPIFLFSGFAAGKESKAVKGLGTVLEKKIPIEAIELAQNSYIFDHEGELISEITSNQQNRVYIRYENIPEAVKVLYIASEDQRFFEHIGFDAAGMLRAVFINAKNQAVEQGGSTITQQLARNVYLSHEQTYNRKLSELLYSYQLEKNFTKEQILEAYLNAIYFGNGTYGIGTAATFYFSRQIQELHLAELVFISAIPNNPTMYDPIKNFGKTKDRQERLLSLLYQTGTISKQEMEEAVHYPITLSINKKVDSYPDYVTFVHEELKQLISEKEGYAKKLAKSQNKEQIEKQLSERVNDIISKGIIIHTALDSSIQTKLDNALEQHIPSDRVQGAAAVIDHQSHKIVALSGGKDYKKYSFHRAYQAYRHPGSAIKPLLDYAPYIDLTGATANSKIDAGAFCKADYCPENYSKKNYGMVSLETALKYSYNTAAVRMLDKIGIDTGLSYLEPFGFSALLQNDYELSAALGALDISPLEITGAYTAFANNGLYVENHAIHKVTDLSGKTLYEWKENPVRVWKETTNDQMRKLLAAVVKSGTGQKAAVSSEYVGGKTGTSSDYRDLWFVGLTDRYTAGVWVGKDQAGNVSNLYDQGPQLLIWRDIMK